MSSRQTNNCGDMVIECVYVHSDRFPLFGGQNGGNRIEK